ncbi:hypothetical protein BC332_03634 [Capsicum chinense]|nr:hypothetical protein BC332_03634 [Capsicum chinense]
MSTPYQLKYEGIVKGVGSVLEQVNKERATVRMGPGSEIYVEFLGGSFTSAAYHMIEPDPEGSVVLCMEKVLVQSRVKSEDVNYINAHVASTPAGDLNKYQAILHCFGENPEVTTLFFEKSTHTTCSQQPLSNTLKMISRELFGQATQATA